MDEIQLEETNTDPKVTRTKKVTKEKEPENNSEEMNKKIEILNKVVSECEKSYGKNSLIRLNKNSISKVPMLSSDILSLDDALGGGFAKGRVIEIFGPESSGKTSMALHAIAKAQKNNGIAAFIDAEHALDPTYAQRLGVDINNLWLSQPDTAEQGLSIAESLIDSGIVDIIVVDSVSALVPNAETEGDFGDSHVGLVARLMSQAMRKLAGKVSKTNTTLIFINQIRMKIGVKFGSPETTSGGNALKFAASQRIDIRKIETIEEGEEVAVANKVRVKIVKNKVGIPFKKCELVLAFNKGFSALEDTLDLAVKYDIIKKSGSWFSIDHPDLGNEKLGQGRSNVVAYLEANPDKYEKIYALTKEAFINN